MSKEQPDELMAECLEEAIRLHGEIRDMLLNSFGHTDDTPGIDAIATIAGFLYQERCRWQEPREATTEQAVMWDNPCAFPGCVNREVTLGGYCPAHRYEHPRFKPVSRAPVQCPDCSLVWEEGHLCPAAGANRASWRCPSGNYPFDNPITFDQAVQKLLSTDIKHTDSQAVRSDSTTEPVPESAPAKQRTSRRQKSSSG